MQIQRIKRSARPTILGYARSGKPIFAIAGGAGEGEGGSEGEGGEGKEGEGSGEGSGEEGEEGSGSEGGEGSGGANDDGGKGGDEPVSREEFNRVMQRMKAADRRASEAERKAEEYERKEKSDLENLQTDLDNTTKERDGLQEENQTLRMRLAVLTSAGSRFNDPEDVLRFVDYTDIADDDGEIDKKAVKSALDDLAKNKPYLLRQEGGEGEGGEGEGGETPPPSTPNPRGGKRKDSIDRETLEKKYPALRR